MTLFKTFSCYLWFHCFQITKNRGQTMPYCLLNFGKLNNILIILHTDLAFAAFSWFLPLVQLSVKMEPIWETQVSQVSIQAQALWATQSQSVQMVNLKSYSLFEEIKQQNYVFTCFIFLQLSMADCNLWKQLFQQQSDNAY